MTTPPVFGRQLGDSITVVQALQEYPELIDIVRIREAGGVFRNLVNDAGELDGVVDTFHRQQGSDALWIFDLNDAVGVKILDEDYGGGTAWKKHSGLADVIDELRGLSEPERWLAPRFVKASSLLWVP